MSPSPEQPAGSFAPDSPLVADVSPSPNFNERPGGRTASMLILHYTGMDSEEGARIRLCDPESKVSSHYLVYSTGRIVQMVREADRAWHAGVSSWRGRTDINSDSIGIEIANPGHDFGLDPYPDIQIESVIALSRDIIQRHGIQARMVIGHSDIAPARKQDPGEHFPWDRLAAEDIGLWVTPSLIGDDTPWLEGHAGEEVGQLQRDLARYGYGIAASGRYERETFEVVTAFQRHFRQQRVDGKADDSTRATLARLLEALPKTGGEAGAAVA